MGRKKNCAWGLEPASENHSLALRHGRPSSVCGFHLVLKSGTPRTHSKKRVGVPGPLRSPATEKKKNSASLAECHELGPNSQPTPPSNHLPFLICFTSRT